MKIRAYYRLTKPGIIYGNLLTAVSGFLLGSRWHIRTDLFLMFALGLGLVIGSACVFNNYVDRDIDSKMARTRKRALASGLITGRHALMYATVLGAIGFMLLALFVNSLTVLLGAIAFIDYVILYGITKRRSTFGTLVGSIAGAMPPAAGYVAATNRLDSAAWLLFLIVVLWQMPHFYAIAMYRLDDYKSASLPVLPVVKGMRHTKLQILYYIGAFTVAALWLAVAGYTGYIYAATVALLGSIWLFRGVKGLRAKDDAAWARSMFLFSLIVITVLSVIIPVGTILP